MNRRSSPRIAGGLLAAITLLAGCQSGPPVPSYVAPPLPDAQLATLKTGFAGVGLQRIDGAKPRGGVFTKTVKVGPGTHDYVITWGEAVGNMQYSYEAAVRFALTPGHTYKLDPREGASLSLHDETTDTLYYLMGPKAGVPYQRQAGKGHKLSKWVPAPNAPRLPAIEVPRAVMPAPSTAPSRR